MDLTNLIAKNRKNAFTLAEVLITLGIIGVVAALTLPTLIQHHRKTAVETSLAKFYSVVNQAVKMAEVEYGDVTQWDNYEDLYEKDADGKNDTTKPIPNAEFFNKYFAPYLKTLKVKPLNNSNLVAAYLTDGSLALFSAQVIIFYPNAKDYETIIDENGTFKVDQSKAGVKSFLFFITSGNLKASDKNFKYHYGKGVEPYMYAWEGTTEDLYNDNMFGCKKESVTTAHAYCTALIQQNGWKIPDNYPFKF